MRAKNNPKKGDSIKVEPIKAMKDIKAIKKLLSGRPRDLAIFTVGVNTNLRGSDLVKLKVGQVRGLLPGDHLCLKEKKTEKFRRITLNRAAYEVIQALLATMPDVQDDDYLFQSRKKAHGGPLSVSYLNRLVTGWCEELNLKGRFGSHTLRKTWGYMQRTVVGTDLPTLMTMFNHSTQRQTLEYLCIQEDEVQDAYLRGEF